MGGLHPRHSQTGLRGRESLVKHPPGGYRHCACYRLYSIALKFNSADNKWLSNLMDRETLRPFALNDHAAIDSWIPGYDNGSPAGILKRPQLRTTPDPYACLLPTYHNSAGAHCHWNRPTL